LEVYTVNGKAWIYQFRNMETSKTEFLAATSSNEARTVAALALGVDESEVVQLRMISKENMRNVDWGKTPLHMLRHKNSALIPEARPGAEQASTTPPKRSPKRRSAR
jgi:hypothetical protein